MAQSIAVWCTVSRDEYALLRYTMRNLLEHPAVQSAVIVHTGRAAADSYGEVQHCYPAKVREFHHDFGEGLDRSLEDGGYNQLAARNFAVQQAEHTGATWLLQFDADEYFSSRLLTRVASLGPQYDVVCTAYCTLLSEGTYWHEPGITRQIRGREVHHPHYLIWRSVLERRCELCPVSERQCRNITRHSSVTFQGYPHWRIHFETGWDHFHLHCILGKEHAARRTTGVRVPQALDPDLQDCIRAISSSHERTHR